MLKIFIVIVSLIPGAITAQTDLFVNGELFIADSDCAKIQSIDGSLDTVKSKRVIIYNAEISNNCLEIGIVYGGCKANVELITDNKIIESQSLKLNFLLRYIESDVCTGTIKTKLSFDLLPFKNMKTGRIIFISLMGTNYNLNYK